MAGDGMRTGGMQDQRNRRAPMDGEGWIREQQMFSKCAGMEMREESTATGWDRWWAEESSKAREEGG